MSDLKLWMNPYLPERQRIEIADSVITALQAENENLKCCGNCRYYKSHECYCFHNWEPYKKCLGEGKHKWKFASR